MTGVTEETVEDGGKGQTNHGAKQEYGQKYLMEGEFLVEGEDVQDKGVDPRTAGAAAVKYLRRCWVAVECSECEIEYE